MVRKVTPSQFNQMMRQAQSNYERKARELNRAIDRVNRDLKQAAQNQVRQVNRVIDDYNRKARAHNAKVAANQSRIESHLRRIAASSTSARYVTFRTSVLTVNRSYQVLQGHDFEGHANRELLEDMPSEENANNLALFDALANEITEDAVADGELGDTAIVNELRQIDADLHNRWGGAVFSLSPRNPDAARHFCTSAREIITSILDIRVPDAEVRSAVPNCQLTKQGRPTRREKLRYALTRKGIVNGSMDDFVDADISNILELFDVFNSATHGAAGVYELPKLRAIKKRVEGGILFLTRIVN